MTLQCSVRFQKPIFQITDRQSQYNVEISINGCSSQHINRVLVFKWVTLTTKFDLLVHPDLFTENKETVHLHITPYFCQIPLNDNS